MKAIKLILILFFIFNVKVFSQNPLIENVNICTTTGSSTSIEVLNPSPSSTYAWEIKTPSQDWTPITALNAGTVYDDYNTSILNIVKSVTLPITASQYRVIATNISGNLISNEAIITVNPLSIAKSISGASPVCIGGDKLLSYGADSVGDIQWQASNISGTLGFEDINLATLINYQATNIQDDTWFRVMNTSGNCNPVYSNAVKIVVDLLPVIGNIEGGDISVCKSSNRTDLYLYDSEGSISWQKSTNIEGPYTSINSASTYIYKALSLTTSTYFRVSLSRGVCPSIETEPVFINVDPTPVTRLITGALPVCSAGSITLNYGEGSVGEIQWQTSTTSSIDDFSDEDGQTGLICNLTKLAENTWVRVMNTSGECEPVYSPAVQIVVNELSESGFFETTDFSVCQSSNSTILRLYEPKGTIQWQSAVENSELPSDFNNIALANRNIYTASSLQNTTYFRAVVTNGVCPPVISENVKIVVDKTPLVKTISGATSTCAGSSKVLVYESGSFGDIQWQKSPSPSSSEFTDIDGVDTETFVTTNLKQTTWFRVANSNGVCKTQFSPIVKLEINPLPVSGTITGGNTKVSSNLNNTELNLIDYKGSIQWQKTSSLSNEFADIPNSSSSLYNATGLNQSTYFRASVSNESCAKVYTEPVIVNVDSDLNITLFPIPFYNDFNLTMLSCGDDPIEIEVFDFLGRTIERQIVKYNEIESKKMGGNYLSGFYTILIKQGQKNKIFKILKN